jgi:alpha-beta hydrolase superfamily lysophospholipase
MRKLIYVVLFVLLISILGCAKQAVEQKEPARAYTAAAPEEPATEQAPASKYTEPKVAGGGMRSVTLTTEDEVSLAASYYPGNEKAVILVHMVGKDRHTWDSLAKRLNTMGFTVISFDLRGHGSSDLNWMDFKDPDFKMMTNDVKAAADYIYEKSDVDIERTYIVGASIGANLAAVYGATDPKVKALVMMSPGSIYHGVNPIDAVTAFNKPILFVYSTLDNYASNSARTMMKIGKGERKEIVYRESNAHGTDMFAEHPELEKDIIDFINS